MSKFTAAQRAEIMAQTRRTLASDPRKPKIAARYIEQDVADTQTQITAMRREIDALKEQVASLASQLSAVAEDAVDARSYARSLPMVQAPQVSGELRWWEWVDARIDARLDARIEELCEDIGTALGEKVRDVCEEFGQANDTRKGEIELLRREFGVLRDEVGVERGLRDLRTSVAKAQRAVPKIPAIEARLRGEATIAKVDTDREIAELRRELKQAQRTIVSLQVRQAKLPDTLERVLDQVQKGSVEYESCEQRMVFRPRVSPEAASALRVFAAQILGIDDGPTIIQH